MYHNAKINIDGQPQFSGHETFPMRYGWLKKAYDAVPKANLTLDDVLKVFNSEDSIAQFGVGRNMVRSIRHWATHCDVIRINTDASTDIKPTIGQKIFDPITGLDPYMENPATLWLLHWRLATTKRLATWFSVFNLFYESEFTSQSLVEFVHSLCQQNQWRKVAKTTLQRDVECFIRSYVVRQTHQNNLEATFDAPLSELGLIQEAKSRDVFHLHRSERPTLTAGIFTFSLLHFWSFYSQANTLSLEAMLYQPKSPGRIFQLTEEALVNRLLELGELTDGGLTWSETAGLKQLIKDTQKIKPNHMDYIDMDYQ